MRFYGQWDPPVDKIIYERYLNYEHGVFIECGAFDGVIESSCKFFEESLNWTGFNIEPVSMIYKKLCENRPNCVNINVALSNSNGTKEFIYADHPNMKLFGNGSLSHTKKHHNLLKLDGCKFEKYLVKTITYADLVSQFNINNVDLFVLDVEGHEIEVIEGMKRSVMPKIMCVEHGIKGEEIKKSLSKLGYTLDHVQFNNSYFVRNS